MRLILTIVLMMVTSVRAAATDTLTVDQPKEPEATEPKKKELSWLRRTIRGFSYIDENYVEPQHYNWSVMLLGRYAWDFYRLSTTGSDGQLVAFSPRHIFKVGPYFGWRWVFLGYTVDLRNISLNLGGSGWKGIDASIYSAQIGADVYYHHTQNDYMLREVNLGKGVNERLLEDVPFDGINVGTTGVNLYYIFNHQRFSYPAAFAQSTCQKISCGSWMAGIGYLSNSLEFDHEKFQQLVDERYGEHKVKLDSALMFNSVKYYNINASVGYAYNWVFARNCLFCASGSVALAYKKSRGETANDDKGGFDVNNFNVDAIGRFGLVYNNTRWYAGANAIVRTYRYKQDRFVANNVLGEVCLFIGYNFGLRSQYKKKK